MTQPLVDRFAQEYPTLSRKEVSAAVDAALAQFTQDGLTFKASDIVDNVRIRLDGLLSEKPETYPYRSSPRPTIPPPPKPRGLLRRLLDCIRG